MSINLVFLIPHSKAHPVKVALGIGIIPVILGLMENIRDKVKLRGGESLSFLIYKVGTTVIQGC